MGVASGKWGVSFRVITLAVIPRTVIVCFVIESFGSSETESIFQGLRVRGLPLEIQERARRKLRMINQAHIIQDLSVPPGNRLEQLKGDLAGFWSVRINQQWRIIFRWEQGATYEVRIVDYH
jgi:proteic killer suppression protein